MNRSGSFILAVVSLAGLLVLSSQALAAPEDAVKAAETAWAQSVLKGDLPGLRKALSDKLIYAHSTGAIESKDEYVKRLETGVQVYDVIDHQKVTVVLHGRSAVVHAIVRMAGTSDTRKFDSQLMMIHLWVKNGKSWQLAAHQTTKLPDPEPAAKK